MSSNLFRHDASKPALHAVGIACPSRPRPPVRSPLFLSVLFLGWIGLWSQPLASEVVLRTVASGTFTNVVRNGGFEQTNSGRFTGWTALPNGYRVADGEGRSNSVALACDAPDTTGYRGASQALTLNRTDVAPITVRGWSRAENVSGNADNDYSLYVDIVHADGTPLWGQTGNFHCGTHDWERQEFTIFPNKPVRSLSLYCLLRGGHSGRVWFDDVTVEELRGTGTTLLFQGIPMELAIATHPPPAATSVVATTDGLRLGLAGQRVVSLHADGRDLTGPVAGGFLARDVAANSNVYLFQDGACPELALRLDATVTARSNHIVIEGRVNDTAGRDRAVMLLFALPIDATGWQWHEDLRQARTVQGSDEFSQTTAVKCGATGTMSVYPLAALTDGQTGLGLAIDMGRPSQYRLVYHAGTRQLFVACDFGLVPETDQFPGAADFRFVLFLFEPKWGFRAGWAKLQSVFPDYFAVRSRTQGIWMPFTDVSKVQGWEDFGFRYHEGNNNVPFDDQHEILSFRYTEPTTWWMSMATNVARTLPEALRVRDEYAQGPSGNNQRMATISKTTAMFDATGQPSLLFLDTPWANGAVWSLNPNPLLPVSPNAATVYWNDSIKARLYSNTAPAGLDGEYLDSLEGYVTAELNLRRDHFRWTTVPLTFTSDSRQPALFKGLSIYEFTRWISDDVHRFGRLMFANGVPYRFGFLCPWLDVMGTETDWLSGGAYQPSSHAQMAYWRTLSGAKPYLLLMNTDYEAFGPYVERYFQRSLFYGMYPSMFSHNAAENPYWQNPKWYNRDRALFQKYLPVIRRIAEAGWQPVTGAACDNSAIWVERYGPDANGTRYYTLFTDSSQAQSGVLLEEDAGTGSRTNFVATELLSGAALTRAGGGWKLMLSPRATAVVRIESGPRFRSAQLAPGEQMRLTIESPLQITQVLESSPDLHAWQPLTTNSPSESPFVVDVPWVRAAGAEFYQLRF